MFAVSSTQILVIIVYNGVGVCVLWHVCIGVHNKFMESILFCFYMSSGDWTQVSRLYQQGQPQIVF